MTSTPGPFIHPTEEDAVAVAPDELALQWARTLQREGFDENNVRSTLGVASHRDRLATLGTRPESVWGQRTAQGPSRGEIVIKEVIGEGGMGVVKLARQRVLERDVAVKTVHAARAEDGATDVLFGEAMITGILEHPNIVPIYTVSHTDLGEPLVVMKRILGRSWLEYINNPALVSDRGTADALEFHLNVFLDVCQAIDFAHSRGILHRDIKPENVMIGEFGEVYVLDWGMAVSVQADHAGRFPLASEVAGAGGTPAYMAPEMTTGDGRLLGKHTDVYLLGAVLHHILTGEPPHRGNTVMQALYAAYLSEEPFFPASIPDVLAGICKRAMAARPQDRYPTVESLLRAIQEFLRQRVALDLIDAATARLDRLLAVLARPINREDVALEVHQNYSECRFGFEQALNIWPDHLRAERGREQAIRAMIGFELSQGHPRAAHRLLGDLEQPDSELQQAVDALMDDLTAREQEAEALRLKQQDNDLAVGSAQRSRFMIGLAIAGLLPLGYHLLPATRAWAQAPTHAVYVGMLVPFFAGLALALTAGLRLVAVNAANRRLASVLVVGVAALLAHRCLAWVRGIPVLDAMMQEFVLIGLAFAVLGILLDRRVLLGVVPWLVAALLAMVAPAWTIELYAISQAVALVGVASVWGRT